MTAKKYFLIILRIFFILSSILFIKEVFYKWDGYSYYMRFIEFLPDLSLAFILWTIPGVILAFASWLVLYVLFKITPKSLISIRLEHIIVFFILAVVLLFIKRAFFGHISINDLTNLSSSTILIISSILMMAVVWFVRKYVEKILYELNSHITPLVWLFGLLLVLAVSLSIYQPASSKAKYMPDKDAHVTSQEGVVRILDKKRPNIILVIMDALTAKDMQVYGYHRPTTPFISEWAKDAVVFNRAYSSSNWTTPSVMSLMTGQRPWTHRVWYHAINFPVKNYKNNLPNILRDNGYNIYGFIQNQYAHVDILGIGESFLTKAPAETFNKNFYYKGGIISSFLRFFENRPYIVRNLMSGYPINIKKILKKF